MMLGDETPMTRERLTAEVRTRFDSSKMSKKTSSAGELLTPGEKGKRDAKVGASCGRSYSGSKSANVEGRGNAGRDFEWSLIISDTPTHAPMSRGGFLDTKARVSIARLRLCNVCQLSVCLRQQRICDQGEEVGREESSHRPSQ